MDSAIEVMLFDLGGVLIELGDHPIPPHWLPPHESFRISDWFTSKTAIAFEQGNISPRQFADSLKKELKLEVEAEEIIRQFTLWPEGLFPTAADLLVQLRGNYRLAVFSNTNELHWPRLLDEFKLSLYFDQMFASHLLHMAKPDLGAFRQVLAALSTTPDKVLFFDDNAVNIAAAEAVGIHAVQVDGVEAVQLYLRQHRLIEL